MNKMFTKIASLFGAVAICTASLSAMAFASGNYFSVSTTSQNQASLEKEITDNGYKYGLKTRYNTGVNINPFDNPSIVVEAGAEPLKHRYVYAELKTSSNGEYKTAHDENSNTLGSGVEYIKANAWKYGDYGVGKGIARVYSDYKGNNLVAEQKINVTW